MARELRRHNESVRLALLPVAALAALSLLASSASAGGGTGESSLQFGYGKDVRYARAIKFCNVYRADSRLRECLTKQLFELVLESHDSAHELPRIDAYAARTGGYLQRSCHVLMHGVGRRYAAAVHATIGRLLDYLPRTNDANCSAGFGHGLLMYLAPQIGSLSPEEAANACNGAADALSALQLHARVRARVHAPLRRAASFRLARVQAARLEERGRLRGRRLPRLLDRGRGPRQRKASLEARSRLRASSARRSAGGFVRGCWYRALLERPPPRPIERGGRRSRRLPRADAAPARLVRHRRRRRQRRRPVQPRWISASRSRGADVRHCVRGVRVPDLAQGPGCERLQLIRRCAHVAHGAQQAACYRWLGMALNVVTNGRFATKGCPALRFVVDPRRLQRPAPRATKDRSRRSARRRRRQPRAGSRRAGRAARAASGRPPTRPARPARAPPAPARAARAHASASIAFTSTASSTSAIARSCSTVKKPGPVANAWTSSVDSPTCTRVVPAFSVAMSGAWRASTPISPSAPGTIIIIASPSNAAPSGVTSETEKLFSNLTPRRAPAQAPARSVRRLPPPEPTPPPRRRGGGPSPRPSRSCRPCRTPAREGRRACPRGSRRSP